MLVVPGVRYIRAELVSAAVSTWDQLASLPVEIERYDLEGRELVFGEEFVRYTTLITLHGGGEEGVGEDVVYDGSDHFACRGRRPTLPLAGSWTLGSFSDRLGELDLFPDGRPRASARAATAAGPSSRRRSTWRCARPAARCAEQLGREPQPAQLRRLDAPRRRTGERRARDLRAHAATCSSSIPSTRFKLDPTNTWTDELIEELAATGAVDSLDLKGQYKGTPVDVDTDPELYAQARRGVPRRLARGPGPQRRDAADARAAPRPRHLGRADPFGRRHPRARMAAAHGQHQAVALRLARRARPRLRLLRASAASAPTAAARPSSASGATTSSTWPRSSIPTRPTTSRRGGFNQPEVPDGLPESPIELAPAPTGFRFA